MLFSRSLPSSLVLFILSYISIATAASDYTISSFDSIQDTGLSSACNTVYSQPIPACQPYDFSAINPCSASCLESLQSLQMVAQSACMGQSMPAQSMLAYFRDGTGVLELCTTLKQVATTMITSTIPSATSSPSQTSASSSAAASTTSSTSSTILATPSASAQADAGVAGTQSSGMLGLSKPILVAVIVGIVVALAIILLVAALMFRKHYR